MSTPLLATKLYVPPPRPNRVLRPRLIERLNGGLHRKLTLVSAPAGFGKSMLLSDWASVCARPAAWLSLDAEDSNLQRFLQYLVAALQTVAPDMGTEVVEVLQSPQPPSTEALLTALLNEVAVMRDRCVLVLDDYHLLDSPPVDTALAFLLEHLPPQLHLVIATREDPQLPLARLRARDHVTDLRAADLRFTPNEAAAFLMEVVGPKLSKEDVAALEARTEGWIAGLQLAALSMQGHQDVAGFVRSFAGDDRYIVDYLLDEVLQRQSGHVRSFLLQTSILDRLSGSLCDAVTGDPGSNVLLEALHRGNFFVVPLDDKRQWYRYHHLFANVLSAQLMAEQPDQVAALHRRASLWYEQHGFAPDAIRHALAAEDWERAADLVELAVPAMGRSRQEATLLGWMEALPNEVIQCRPVLSLGYAGALLSNGKLEGVEDRLRDAERWLNPIADISPLDDPSAAMVVVDNAAFRRLPGSIAVYRAGLALARGNVPDTVLYARRSLDLVAEDDHLWRGAAAALLGLATWTSGDLEVAYRSYAGGMAHLQMTGNIADAVGGTIALADIRIVQGRLGDAMRTYERGLQLATEQGNPRLRGTADMYVGMSELLRERDDLVAATHYLLVALEQGEHTGFPQHPYRWRVAMARIREAEGDLAAALDLLHEAERRYVSDFYPHVRPVSALKTRVWVRQGRLREALDWTREQGLSARDDLSYLREFEHLTLSRVLLARVTSDAADRSLRDAMRLLDRLQEAAEAGHRWGSVIEILVLQALAHQKQGNTAAALASLRHVLTLAEPEGYVRIFVDEGQPMATLLQRAANDGIAPNYVRRLLGALGTADDRSPVKHTVIEPLSERELDVLRLFTTELSGPEIAHQLMIAVSTLRTHTKSIYGKLDVNNRRAAVRRAAELHLI
jgi:LuxR family transcriptional regulator, maltose regulon positive regulatory protein